MFKASMCLTKERERKLEEKKARDTENSKLKNKTKQNKKLSVGWKYCFLVVLSCLVCIRLSA
jgi:hypothetical protein